MNAQLCYRFSKAFCETILSEWRQVYLQIGSLQIRKNTQKCGSDSFLGIRECYVLCAFSSSVVSFSCLFPLAQVVPVHLQRFKLNKFRTFVAQRKETKTEKAGVCVVGKEHNSRIYVICQQKLIWIHPAKWLEYQQNYVLRKLSEQWNVQFGTNSHILSTFECENILQNECVYKSVAWTVCQFFWEDGPKIAHHLRGCYKSNYKWH